MNEGQEKFCPMCGASLEHRPSYGRERPVCPECEHVVFYSPKLVVVGLLVQDEKVLLVRRGMNPGKGLWGMPGGYVDLGEVLEDAVSREIWEETGLETQAQGLIALHSEEGRPQVLAVYEMEAVGGNLHAGSEVTDVGFFSMDKLPPLAFPRDAHLLESHLHNRP